jgi:molybdenum transport protein
MLRCLPDAELERYVEEDVPYGDLTTHLLGIGGQPGRAVFSTRETTRLCCTEEAGRVLEMCGAIVVRNLPSGTELPPRHDFLEAEGSASSLHAGWKVALNLLEYGSGIAGRTARVVSLARSANPAVAVVTTRKSFPGTKKIAIKAAVAGGALPHRLGLSETVLVFRQHTEFLGGLDAFLGRLDDVRRRAPETKIIVEAETAGDAQAAAAAGVDVVQVDKVPPPELRRLVAAIRERWPGVRISAAGGIHEGNAAEYAATGVDIIVLSAVYFGKPADIGVRFAAV